MKPRDVLYLKINDIREYNLPYPQSTFTHNLGTTNISFMLQYIFLLLGRIKLFCPSQL